MADYNIAVIGGDGVGPEVTAEALRAMDAAGQRFGFTVATEPYDLGGRRYRFVSGFSHAESRIYASPRCVTGSL